MREKQFIERGELINRFEENLKYQEDNKHWEVARGTRVAINAIRNLPAADVVEVVRCKDCEHYNTSCCADGFGWCEQFNRGEMDSHFCSYGERKCDNG